MHTDKYVFYNYEALYEENLNNIRVGKTKTSLKDTCKLYNVQWL